MTNDQLLKELQSRGMLDAAAAQQLLKDALIAERPVEALIHDRRLVPDENVGAVKSELFKVPYQKIDPAGVTPELLVYIPEETARTYGVIPLSRQNNVLVVGMLAPDDAKAQEALRFLGRQHRVDLGVYVISYGDFEAVLRKYSPYRSSVEQAVRSFRGASGAPADARKVIRLDEDIAKGGEEAPIIKIVADTFKEAIESNASDVHIEPQETYLRVRFRVDGDLKEAASLPVELTQPVTSRIKVLSNLKIDETRIPQDGRFRAKIMGKDIDFRVATFPTPLGEKIAIRVLDPSKGLKGFEDLGLAGKNLEAVIEGIAKPFGMILITGPTGSGKTTTLYALLAKLNREAVNIVSLEDPVEYFVAGMNQSQVRPEIGYDFASGLRQILRQDPDIIMVGEIRDNETAALAVQAALTGHIVLSTLHTNNAAGVIPRLIDMKVEPFLIPVSLNLMLSQRLLGRLCPDCKKGEQASAGMSSEIAAAIELLPADAGAKYKKPYTVYRAAGCATCKGRGIVGRIAIYEVLRMTPALEDIVNAGPSAQKIAGEAKRQGMITLRADAVMKALDGVVSMEEALRNTAED